VASVEYAAKTPLPDGQRDAFELSLQLPDKAGETLTFPAIQTCEQGETAWTEVPADGQDADELEHPAPAFEITEASDGGHGSAAGDDQDGEADAAANTENASADTADGDDGMSSTLGVIALVLGALGLGAGGAALVQVRRRA
jgi:hypothetical protein